MSKKINRDALKKLSTLFVDLQHLQQIALGLFNYQGELNEQITESAKLFDTIVTDAHHGLDEVKIYIHDYKMSAPEEQK